MLLNTEELLALVNGDAEPDRLADLLDRLEHCPESADALEVLVALRANREVALATLRRAEEREATEPAVPHPAFVTQPSRWAWATQGLRVAATVALVAVLSVWAANGFFTPDGMAVDTSALATQRYENIAGRTSPQGAEFTSDTYRAVELALDAMDAGEYSTARSLLESATEDGTGIVTLHRGMSDYFEGNYEAALANFIAVQEMKSVEHSAVLHQAAWYEANALLALDRPNTALSALEKVTSADGYPFKEQATTTYRVLREALGMTPPHQD